MRNTVRHRQAVVFGRGQVTPPPSTGQVSAAPRAQASCHPSREALIIEAAYHRAEARHFAPGHALDDWLAAEAEVDARLSGEGRAY